MMRYFLALLVFVVLTVQCKQKEVSYLKIGGETMGTYYLVTHDGGTDITKAKIDQLLIEFNESVSTYIPTSTISRINEAEDSLFFVNDHYFLPVFEKSQVLYDLSGGDLNVYIMPLVNYWGFGIEEIPDQIDTQAVLALKSIVNESGLTCVQSNDSLKVYKATPETKVDFSSLAKGYGIDVLAEWLDAQGVGNYLIDIGGEARAKGKNQQGKTWALAINKPSEESDVNEMELVVALDHLSIATSGNYRNYYMKEGKKVVHTINPKTGYPQVSNLLSASVIAEDCMTADGLATTLMVKGVEESIEFLKNNPVKACLIYDGDGKEPLEKYYANGFRAYVKHEK